jgi:excisionase family DNA binding protein
MKPSDQARSSRHRPAAPADVPPRVLTGHSPGTSALHHSDSHEPGTRRADRQSAAPDQARRLLTLEEAAAYLALSTWTVRDLVWKGRLPVVRLTRRLHFDRHDLDRLIEHAKDSG